MPRKLLIAPPRIAARASTLLTLLLPACGASPAPRDDAAERAAFALVQSPPGQWIPAFEAVLACGSPASAALVRAVEANPHSPGAQPAVTALGCLGDHGAEALLIRLLDHQNPDLAAEAALALARLGAQGARQRLLTTMADGEKTTYVRAAAAAALLDLGDRERAVDFAGDLLLAPTDRGRNRALELRLPVDQVRWAVERNLAIVALTRAARGESFGLDADASWPELAAGVERVRTHFGRNSR